jgi:hypothetical protein
LKNLKYWKLETSKMLKILIHWKNYVKSCWQVFARPLKMYKKIMFIMKWANPTLFIRGGWVGGWLNWCSVYCVLLSINTIYFVQTSNQCSQNNNSVKWLDNYSCKHLIKIIEWFGEKMVNLYVTWKIAPLAHTLKKN